MKQFEVNGMSCAACVARVEKAVSKVEGVSSCTVSLLTHSMGVEGTASDQAIIAAVESAGYAASIKGSAGGTASPSGADALADRETPALRRRLLASLGFLLALMYVSMGHAMWGWPLPAFFDHNPVAIGIVQLLLCTAVMVINQRFFISGF
ncbi:MAG: cation transporter, partial [Clostridia bacterium]|nr:cation transporter [Clostridia bacterium]